MTQSNDRLGSEDLTNITNTTLGHYSQNAEGFWHGTHDHDVSQNIDALLRNIQGDTPFRILDFGCGPGRDLADFHARGHIAIGLDGSHRFCDMARAHSGCEVLCQDFLSLELPPNHFDGIFANASLFHVPSQELPRVLGDLCASLKHHGVLFSSNPRGRNEEGWNGSRYGSYHDFPSWSRYLTAAGFEHVEHYFRPTGRPRHEQPWLATVFRRV